MSKVALVEVLEEFGVGQAAREMEFKRDPDQKPSAEEERRERDESLQLAADLLKLGLKPLTICAILRELHRSPKHTRRFSFIVHKAERLNSGEQV